MMIIPALLTTNPTVAAERIERVKHMGGWLHIDILDNSLYKFSSLAIEELSKLNFGRLKLEFHCMSDDPLAILDSGLSVDRLCLHLELPDWQDAYDTLINRGINTWLAIDPSSDLTDLVLPEDVTGVLLMGVVPGVSGQALLPDTFERLDRLKDTYPDIPVTVDGGVAGDNLRQLLACGADSLVMGSAIFGAADPAAAYRRFEALSDPIGGAYDSKTA